MSSSSLASVASVSSHVDMEAMEALLEVINDALDLDNIADTEEVELPCNITGPWYKLHN